MIITPAELIEYASATGKHVEAQALGAIEEATAYVAAYTRFAHLEADGTPRPGVKEVVRSVAGRIVANPAGVATREQIGQYSYFLGEGFTGFTLGEIAILNRYRKRAIG